jgi:hypothetical protein
VADKVPPSPAHLEAAKRFWPVRGKPRFIRWVENFVYTVDLNGTELGAPLRK